MQYMLTINEEQIAQEWEKYLGYTIRPLPSTTQYYEKLIASHGNKTKFLIYGGTPEIRTLFQKSNRGVVLVDRSEQMVKAMGRLTLTKVPLAENERFIKADWLTLNSLNEKFDLIMGDDAINMVSWDNFDLFLNQTYKTLNRGGIFICHLLVKPDDNLINQNFVELLEEYKQGAIKSIYDLASRLNFTCFDKKNHSMGWQQTIEMLGNDKLNILKPYLDFKQVFGLCNSRFYCPPLNLFEPLAKKYFTIKQIFYAHEHEYCLFEPVYVLQK